MVNGIQKNPVAPVSAEVGAKKTDGRDPKMLEAARDFEGQFLRQIIAGMRKTVPKDELIPESMAENIYREQLDDQYADTWTSQGGIGLADIIYDQLNEKYGGRGPSGAAVKKSEFLPLNPSSARPQVLSPKLTDLFSKEDGLQFLVKKQNDGLQIISRKPIEQSVGLHAPLSGLVLQSAATEDGRHLLVVKHDKGLVSRFVHNGGNRVSTGQEISAGQIVAELPPMPNGEVAKVFFGLRKASDTE